jgi:choline kinase
VRQAVILAAGSGSRLGPVAEGLPKCLLRVGPHTLLEHQVRLLRGAGVARVCVVVGHGAERVRAVYDGACDYVVNERHATTNSLHSLWLARHWVAGPFVLLNGDVLLHPAALARVLADGGSALAYDSTSGRHPEHMKVRVADGRVRAIGKRVGAIRVHGESVGLLTFDAAASALVFAAAERILAAGRARAFAPAAVHHISRRVPIRAVDVGDLPWCEIDFADDLRAARERVWPAIAASLEETG